MALKLKGSTSGFVGLDAPSVAGNNTLILPENSGSAFQLFANDITAGVTTFTTVTVNRNGDLTVPGTISIGGTLTYEDVTSVDSIGIVTARGLSIFGNTTGLNVASGISTFQALTGTTGTFSSSVGINQNSPAAKLDIVEATSTAAVKIKSGTSTNQNSSLTFSNDDGGGLMHLGVFGSSAATFGANEANDGFITASNQLSINAQNASGQIRFGVGSTPETKMLLDSSGRLLLGTTTQGEATADDLTIATSGSTGITIRAGTSNASNILFADGTSGDDAQRGIIQYHHSDDTMRLFTNATRRITIDSSGNLGINQSSPAVKLHLYDSSNATARTELFRISGGNRTADSFETGFRFFAQAPSTNGNRHITFTSNANTGLSIQPYETSTGNAASDRDILLCPDGGNIGIGTDDPARKFQIGGIAGCQFQINPHSGGFDLAVTTGDIAPHYQTKFILYKGQIGSGVERFRVSSEGYVTTPHNVMFSANNGPNDQTNGDIVFSNALFQRGGTNYDTSTGYFTVPVNGIYHFMANVYRYNTSDDSYITLQTRSNSSASWSSQIEIRAMSTGAVGWTTLMLSQLIELSSGNQVKLVATNRIHCNGTFSRFSGMLVG